MITPSSVSFFSAANAEDLPMLGQCATTSAPVNLPIFSSVYFFTISYAVLPDPLSDNNPTRSSKTFTQDDVNKIVEERLQRERQKYAGISL